MTEDETEISIQNDIKKVDSIYQTENDYHNGDENVFKNINGKNIIETKEQNVENNNISSENHNNEEDDDFGDFEEASFSTPLPSTFSQIRSQSIEEPDDPFPQSPRKQTEFGFAKFDDKKLQNETSFDESMPSSSNIKTLEELVNDNDIWSFEDVAATSLIVREEEAIDYVDEFDMPKRTNDNLLNLPKNFVDAYKLWSEICFVEDTPALKLQLKESKIYSTLLKSLNMNASKAVVKEKPTLPVMIPTPAPPLELPSNNNRASAIQPE